MKEWDRERSERDNGRESVKLWGRERERGERVVRK